MTTDPSDAATAASDTNADTDTEDGFVPFMGQFFPEALTLSAVLAVLALLVTFPYLPLITQLELFATGFFELFTVQMPLILLWVLSAAVVESRLVGRGLDRVADALPTDGQRKVIYATGFVALLFGWVNWALGFIGAVFVGHRLCRRAEENGVRVHYPLVLTAAIVSLVITTVGLSSPGALLMADASGTTNFLVDPDQGAVVADMSAFLLHPINVVSSLVILFTLPALLAALAPDDESERRPVSEYASLLQGEGDIAESFSHYSLPSKDEWVFADKLEQSRTLSVVTFLLGGISFVAYFVGGGRLTLLWLLFGLMMLGILAQQRPLAFVEKTRDATRWANHIAIPFLLYAAVFALLTEAGLYAPIGSALAATGVTQVASYAVALVLGVFVPSPGSVWVIQGPALIESGADLVPSLLSVMYGAGVSNVWLGFLFTGIVATIHGFDYREYLRYAVAVTAYVSTVVVALLLMF